MMSIRDHLVQLAQQGRDRATDAAAVERPGAAVGSPSPLEVEFLAWGDPDGDASAPCEILATLGSVELEYAAIQRGVGIMDAPHRGAITVKGADAIDLIDRLVTNQVAGISDGDVVDAFVLDRTGRIQSDLSLTVMDADVWLTMDTHDVNHVASMIESSIFTEDAVVTVEATTHHIELYGSKIDALFGAWDLTLPPSGCSVSGHIAGAAVRVMRRDLLLVPGVSIMVDEADAVGVWTALVHAQSDGPIRPLGWYALNMARLEAKSPLFHIDFGRTSLPHETGLLDSRVSFTKGCYPGQEVVARMQHLGHPKQIVRFAAMNCEHLPVAGGHVLACDADLTDAPIGVVTSSAPSPMRGSESVCLATVKWAHAAPGHSVDFQAGTQRWTVPLEACRESSTC